MEFGETKVTAHGNLSVITVEHEPQKVPKIVCHTTPYNLAIKNICNSASAVQDFLLNLREKCVK